ncbi:type II toxin-antitoxin system Phd/YefM family antitoxin [Bacillus niameyensis]|uniref:type II toxin-antitoxin system Phd/YefM family antitoxin n=1 Tax=Bacillus niameyensis TaxID=1522308 RepID=UPI000780B099|nr:type II toxin-antitoxin system Phd/YefM family antitoxin [Bacillus niameyensis]
MIIKPSTSLRYDYNSISQIAREKAEPIYITKNGEDDLVVMSIEAFQKREALLDLKEKLFLAEEQCLSKENTISLDDAYNRLKEKINGKIQG